MGCWCGYVSWIKDFLVQSEDSTGRQTNNPEVLSPIQNNWCSISAISTIFMLDAFPGTTLPVYPGLDRHQVCWLACPVAWFTLTLNI